MKFAVCFALIAFVGCALAQEWSEEERKEFCTTLGKNDQGCREQCKDKFPKHPEGSDRLEREISGHEEGCICMKECMKTTPSFENTQFKAKVEECTTQNTEKQEQRKCIFGFIKENCGEFMPKRNHPGGPRKHGESVASWMSSFY